MLSRPPTGFVQRRRGCDLLLLRGEGADALESVLRDFLHDRVDGVGRRLDGGRGGAVALRLPSGEDVVLRKNLRGGMPARILRDLYFGLRHRPFEEIAAAAELRSRGVRVPVPLGGIVHRLAPLCYRGAVAMLEVHGSETAWDRLRAESDAGERRAICARICLAVDRLHRAGGIHPDLNLRNFLIADESGRRDVWIIDCDKVRIGTVTPRLRASAFRRLRRSARRLDPAGEILDPGWLKPPPEAG